MFVSAFYEKGRKLFNKKCPVGLEFESHKARYFERTHIVSKEHSLVQ